MQYSVRHRRRLRPTTGPQAPVAAAPTVTSPPVAEGSGAHRLPSPTQPEIVEIVPAHVRVHGRSR